MQNIADLRQKLAGETDPERRRVLQKILNAEERKLSSGAAYELVRRSENGV